MEPPIQDSARALVPLPILRATAALVLAASVIAGGRALVLDLRLAFRYAGPSNFPETASRQLEEIRRTIPAGATILLVSESHTDGAWYTRLFQRALYPRNDVIVRYLPLTRQDADALRSRWSISYGVAFAVAPPDVGFDRSEDLGPLPAMPDRVWLGALASP